ncbi:MAG: DUF4465 domain-containing protein [Prevotellaceae bacterium]|jgi:hypothetical protein|nr:DUF4465 domain-containing protein [Prevotellaceae bacterium]
MKTKILLNVAIACTAASLATTGCANNSNARNAKGVGDTLTLNLYDTNCVNWQTDIVQPPVSDATGYWDSTYTNNTLCYGEFTLEHIGIAAWNYWGGFTFGRNGSKTNYGYSEDSIGSVDWIPHQWGVMAGGGIAHIDGGGEVDSVEKGLPYLIAFGSGAEVKLADSSLFTPQEIYICNHPWPYYGNIWGDGFAHPLDTVGAHFYLWIHAVKYDGRENAVPHILAEVEEIEEKALAGTAGKLLQDSTWQRVPLTQLFDGDADSIKLLYFTLETTDVGEFGANTAFYFCMDRLKVVKQEGAAPAAAAVRQAKLTDKTPTVEVKDYLPLASYTGGEVVVHDAKGKVALKTTVKAGEKPNLSKLPAGEYQLRHGHRLITVKKINK